MVPADIAICGHSHETFVRPMPRMRLDAKTGRPVQQTRWAIAAGGGWYAPDNTDPSVSRRPGRGLMDGGRGQLAAAIRGVHAAGVDDRPIASLAKRFEEVYLPGRSDPVPMDENSAGMRVLKAIRDEAHRFAITYHRQVRAKASIQSALDTIPGIGPKRKRALLKKFGSVKGIREADVAEIASTVGFTRVLDERGKEGV